MMICSNTNILLSLNFKSALLGFNSAIGNVSCSSSLPWAVSLPYNQPIRVIRAIGVSVLKSM